MKLNTVKSARSFYLSVLQKKGMAISDWVASQKFGGGIATVIQPNFFSNNGIRLNVEIGIASHRHSMIAELALVDVASHGIAYEGLIPDGISWMHFFAATEIEAITHEKQPFCILEGDLDQRASQLESLATFTFDRALPLMRKYTSDEGLLQFCREIQTPGGIGHLGPRDWPVAIAAIVLGDWASAEEALMLPKKRALDFPEQGYRSLSKRLRELEINGQIKTILETAI